MLIKLGADVEVDIATGDEMAEHVRKGVTGSSAKGRAVDRNASNILPTGVAGDGVFTFGRPPNGQVWNIVTLTVTGSTDSATVAGHQALYVDSDPANLNIGSCKIPGIVAPYFNAISKQTLWAHSSGDVCLNVTGSTGNTVVATIGVVEYRWEEIFDLVLR